MSDIEYAYVKGKSKYLSLVNLNKFGDWAITLYPDTASLEVCRDLQARGIKNIMKKDEDGYYIQFKRAANQNFGNTVVRNLPPEVVDSAGVAMDGSRVGYGSDVDIKLEVTGGINKKMGARWMRAKLDKVMVTNLVPYLPDAERQPDQKAITAGIVDRPKF